MTRANAVLGTPCYMSPEQARGASETDVRSDIYSCGVILYESVSGRLPFDGESFNDLMFKIALSDPPPLTSVIASLDPAFCAIVARAIARDPADRYATAQEFADAVDEWMLGSGAGDGFGLSVASPGPFPAAPRASSATLAAPVALAAAGYKGTGNDASWARSDADATSKRKRGAVVAGGSAAGLAAVCIGIALMVRADPAPTQMRAVTGPPDTRGQAAVAPPAVPLPAATAALFPIPSAMPAAEGQGAADAAPRRHEGARYGRDGHAAQPPRPAGESSKPKTGAPTNGFDLGY
jgi:serine/threonine-protein kinase